MNLKQHIRDVPDFPKPGILFRDITPLLASHEAFAESIHKLAEPWQKTDIDAVAAVEARGFLFAGPLALKLGVGLIPVRKPGKLPADTLSYQYE
jgi:adenine phosphoribosyltransferase